MRVTLLGTGGSAGVPMIGGADGSGDWGACDPSEPRNLNNKLWVPKAYDSGSIKMDPNYKGKYVTTRGPLTVPRTAQGWPVLMQAGSSPRGRDFAARWAEIIFTLQHAIPDMQAFRADIHTRMDKRGRRPEEFLPAAFKELFEATGKEIRNPKPETRIKPE